MKWVAFALALLPSMAFADVFMFAGGAVIRIVVTTQSVSVPNVVGLAAAAADTALEAAALDTGTVTQRCSGFDADVVLSQDPTAGSDALVGSGVDLVTSDGMACPSPGQRPGIKFPAISMPGL